MAKAEPVPEPGVCRRVPQNQCLPCAAWVGWSTPGGEVRRAGSRWMAACAAASTAL